MVHPLLLWLLLRKILLHLRRPLVPGRPPVRHRRGNILKRRNDASIAGPKASSHPIVVVEGEVGVRVGATSVGGMAGVKVAVEDFVEGFALVAAVEEEEEGEEEEGGYPWRERWVNNFSDGEGVKVYLRQRRPR